MTTRPPKRKLADVYEKSPSSDSLLFFAEAIYITLLYSVPSLCYGSETEDFFQMDQLPAMLEGFGCTTINSHISRFLRHYLSGSVYCMCASCSPIQPEKYRPYNFTCNEENKRLLTAIVSYQSSAAKYPSFADFITKGIYFKTPPTKRLSVPAQDRLLTAIAHHNILPPLSSSNWNFLTNKTKLAYYLYYHLTYKTLNDTTELLIEAVQNESIQFLALYFTHVHQPDSKYNELLIVASSYRRLWTNPKKVVKMIEIFRPYCTSPHYENRCALLSSLNTETFSITEYLLKSHLCDLRTTCYHVHASSRLLYNAAQTRMLIEQNLDLKVDLLIMNAIRRDIHAMEVIKVLLEAKATIPYSPVYNPLLKSMLQSQNDVSSFLLQQLNFSQDVKEKCIERSLTSVATHFLEVKKTIGQIIYDTPIIWSSPLGQRLLEEYILRSDLESLEFCFNVKGARVTKSLLLHSLRTSCYTTIYYLLEQELSLDILSSFELIEECMLDNLFKVAKSLLARGFPCNDIHRKLIETNAVDFNFY